MGNDLIICILALLTWILYAIILAETGNVANLIIMSLMPACLCLIAGIHLITRTENKPFNLKTFLSFINRLHIIAKDEMSLGNYKKSIIYGIIIPFIIFGFIVFMILVIVLSFIWLKGRF